MKENFVKSRGANRSKWLPPATEVFVKVLLALEHFPLANIANRYLIAHRP